METIISILIPVTFILMLVVERLRPARRLPQVRGWVWKGIGFFVMSGVINGLVPALLASAIGAHTPLHLTALGTLGGAVVGFLVADMTSYGIHRVMHNVPWLWRWTHQMHHSAERVDAAGGAYFHPFDITLQVAVTAFATLLLGISPDAAALAGYIGFFLGIFQHLNVRTPQWLGYLVQRPEAHSVHHARGVHAYNYGNFMLWDIVLGTFRNPVTFSDVAGFWDGASGEVGAMLVGRDIERTHL